MSTDTAPVETTGRSAPVRRGVILAVILVSYFMIVLDNSIVFTGLARIREDLGFSTAGLSWVQNAYALVFGGLLSPPTKIDRVPAIAPSSPPLTRASTTVSFPSVATRTRSATSRTPDADDVDEITRTVGPVIPARMPSGPSSTSFTCGRSGSISTMTLDCVASSRE
jgi:hypothetical protein